MNDFKIDELEKIKNELEVKYDILRGENYRLSKKLDYYESGKAFETLQRKHDEEIRSLKYTGSPTAVFFVFSASWNTSPSGYLITNKEVP